MDDGRNDEAWTPRPSCYVNDLQLHRVLDESLWQIERRRVEAPSLPRDDSASEDHLYGRST